MIYVQMIGAMLLIELLIGLAVVHVLMRRLAPKSTHRRRWY